MKKITFVCLFVLLSSFVLKAQTMTSTQTFSISGQDDGPTVLSIDVADITVDQGEAISSVTIVNASGNLSNANCGNWYEFTLSVDGAAETTVCAADLNGTDVTGFSNFIITSVDPPSDGFSDFVTITIDLEVVHDIPPCPQPIDLEATPSATEATLTWTETGSATSWVVEYGPEGFAQGAGTTVNDTDGSASQTISGLTPVTVYDFYVRADCGGGDISAWSGPFTFETSLVTPSCGENFYDSGGVSGNYSLNENLTYIFTPDVAGNVVTLDFTFVDIEEGWDILTIYNGSGTGGVILEDELLAPGAFHSTAPDGALTVTFSSDNFVTYPGWEAMVICAAPPSCPAPTDLAVSGIGVDSADLEWTENATATQWDIELVELGQPFTGTPTYAGVTSNPYSATALTSNTEYQFQVRAYCSDGTFSYWVGPFSFQTSVETPECGENFYDSGGVSDVYSDFENLTYIFTPDVPGNVVTLNFSLVDIELCCDDLVVYNGSGTGGTVLAADLEEPDVFHSTAPDGALTVTFTSDVSVSYAGWEAMVICAPPPSCPTPTDLSVTSIGTDSADLGWTENASATQWDVELIEMEEAFTGTPTNSGVANPHNATSLLPGTEYKFKVRAHCSDGTFSYWSEPFSFTTLCAPFGDFSEFFDTTPTGEVPMCWSNIVNSTSDFASADIIGYGSFSAPNNVELYNSDDQSAELLLITPELIDLPSQDHQIRFYADGGFSPTDITLEVGTLTDPADASTFTVIETIPLVDGYEEHIVQFVDPTTDGYVAFRATYASTFNSLNIDDVYWEPIPSCPKPDNLNVAALTTTTAELTWVETGSATSWIIEYGPEGFVQGTGTIVNDTDATPSEIISGLTPNTSYDFYVQADCGGGDISIWSNPHTFITAADAPACGENFYDTGGADGDYGFDENLTYVFTPDTPGEVVTLTFSSVQIADFGDELTIYNGSGTAGTVLATNLQEPDIFHSTAPDGALTVVFTSNGFTVEPGWEATVTCAVPPSCPAPTDLTATPVSITSAELGWTENGSATQWDIEIVEVDQGFTGTPTYTGVTQNPYLAENLSEGTAYHFMVRSYCADGTNSYWEGPFTLATQFPITTSATQYTKEELVTDVLFSSPCVQVSNVTYSAASDFDEDFNSIGYFNQDESSFPFEEGVIMSTGDIALAPGPENEETIQSEGDFLNWPGDQDLEDILGSLDSDDSHNASVLEFDFVPLQDTMRVDFLFASEEYGTFQCNFADAFAFILTDSQGNDVNVALVPDTNIPVAVTTVKDDAYNNSCPSENEEYFGTYYGESPNTEGEHFLTAPINFKGHTVPITAEASVNPGESYHIKLVIADNGDSSYDSAIFLEAGSFQIGEINLGPDITLESGNASCEGSTVTIDSGLSFDPSIEVEITWYKDGEVIPGETESTIDVSDPGIYTISVVINELCGKTDNILVEFYPNPEIELGADQTSCEINAVTLDATPTNVSELTGLTYEWTLDGTVLSSETNATLNVAQAGTYEVVVTTANGCMATDSATVSIIDYQVNIPAVNIPCTEAGETNSYEIIPEITGIPQAELNTVTYEWSTGATTPTITVTEDGTYSVITTYEDCQETASVVINFSQVPQIELGENIEECIGNTVVLNAEPSNVDGTLTYVWYRDGGVISEETSSTLTITETGTFTYMVEVDSEGCIATDKVTVSIIPCNIPEGISPNGDQFNQTFDLSYLKINSIEIFNRYGRSVYRNTQDYTDQWYGQSNDGNELPTGTYYYVIKLKEGKTFKGENVITGWVYINRQVN